MKLNGGKKFLKSTDVNGGEVIVFKDGGEWTESTRFKYDDGSPKMQFSIGITLAGEDKNMNLNKTNRDILIEVYGDETENWIGKQVKLSKVKVLVAGKMMDTLLVEPVSKAFENTQNRCEDASGDEFSYGGCNESEDIPF